MVPGGRRPQRDQGAARPIVNAGGRERRIVGVLAVVLVALLAVDVGALAAHQTPLKWRRVSGQGFSAEFPGAPKPDERNVSVRGTNVAAHLLVLDVRGRHSFGLLYADYPATVDVSNPVNTGGSATALDDCSGVASITHSDATAAGGCAGTRTS